MIDIRKSTSGCYEFRGCPHDRIDSGGTAKINHRIY